MAQPSVVEYFNTRKRAAPDDGIRSKKVLALDVNGAPKIKTEPDQINQCEGRSERERISKKLTFDSVVSNTKNMVSPRPHSLARKNRFNKKADTNQKNIVDAFSEVQSRNVQRLDPDEIDKLYPTTPTKVNLAVVKRTVPNEANLSLAEIQNKLLRSSRLEKIKESLAKLQNSDSKLKELEEKRKVLDSPNSALKQFKTIDLDIPLSPQKVASPQKQYLSPNKTIANSPRRNLLNLLSPTKHTTPSSPSKLAAYQRFASLIDSQKPSFTLPYRYRCLAEQFRCLETVVAMYYNRGELITFKKIRGSVQEMLRKNFTLENLAQIKHIYPDAYNFSQNKVRNFGSTSKHEKYELILTPKLLKENEESKNQEKMSSSIVLERCRKMFNNLVEQVKIYHDEFLKSLDPPMIVPKEKLTRWHPEFDIERVPEIPQSPLPEPPNVEKFTNAKDVLEKARQLFNCNTPMERALERLAQKQTSTSTVVKEEKSETNVSTSQNSILKGIPSSLLEKVRARQAAKALEAMTRTPAKVKESAQYAQLPDLAKYTRNIFIAERKSVLPIESVINKLNNSFQTSFTPSELEAMLKMLADLLPGWLVFHEIRKASYIKLAKDADMTKVLSKLEKLAKEKADF